MVSLYFLRSKEKTIMKYLYVLSLVSASFFSGTAQKTYTVHTIQNVTIDGSINEWDAIPFTDEFVKHDNAGKASQVTKAKIAWDASNIYFAFVAKDMDIKATNGSQDSKIFNTDDLIEFFIDPDGNGENYIEVGVNGLNVYYDYILKCVTASCGGWADDQIFDLNNFESAANYVGTVNTSTDKDTEYFVEIKIPFASLKAIPNGGFTTPKDGDTWNANLFRIDQNASSSAEYLAWNPHNSFGFHQPSKFGKLVFKADPLTAIIDTDLTDLVQFYPNPTTGVVRFNKEIAQVKVFNTFGQLVESQENVSAIDLSSFEKGVYTISMIAEGKVMTEKIIKQ